MERFNAAVIGLGNIGLLYDLEEQRPHPSSHVYAYQMSDSFHLVCGIDCSDDKRKALRAAAPESEFYASIDEALTSRKLQDIDVVSICTPSDTHWEILRLLLEHNIGKVIFCEKPIVSSVDEARNLKLLASVHPDITIIPNISRRWNHGLREVAKRIESGKYGEFEKVNIRYTRGIYNTGSHLFDLLRMWETGKITSVTVLGRTCTSAEPEMSYSFHFRTERGVLGYAEAVDDRNYYLFDIDLYLSHGKIEMRNSGDDVIYYGTAEHHLFKGFREFVPDDSGTGLLSDACLKNAIDNLNMVLRGQEKPYCCMDDAIYPLYVADALERSYKSKHEEELYL